MEQRCLGTCLNSSVMNANRLELSSKYRDWLKSNRNFSLYADEIFANKMY